MANSSATIANKVRILAILHIIVGFLLFCFGIAERVMGLFYWTSVIGFGIWIGVWMCITGGLGIPGTFKEQSKCRNTFAGVFMGFSITSSVFGGIIILNYSINITFWSEQNPDEQGIKREAVAWIILALGFVELFIGICAAMCIWPLKPCTCCNSATPQQGQIMYTGFVMTQGPDGVPVAIPMEATGGMVAVQTVTSEAQGDQSRMVMVPVSGAEVYQPLLAYVDPSGTMPTGDE